MPLSTVAVTGSVLLPDGTTPINGALTFTLTAIDTEGAQVLPILPLMVPLTTAGALPGTAVLWRNSSGALGTSYRVDLTSQVERAPGVKVNRTEVLGFIEIGAAGPYDIGALLAASLPPPPSPAPAYVTSWARGLMAAETAALAAELLRLAPVTVAALAAPAIGLKGARAWVTDATLTYVAANIGAAAVGGGANLAPVWCDGAAWKIG